MVCDRAVNDCARHGVLEGSHIPAEDSGIDSLGYVDVHESHRNTKSTNGSLDLVNLRHADAGYLSFTNTVSVEDHLAGESSVGLLESLKGFGHAVLKRVSCFLSELSLDDTCGEILGGRVVDGSCECKD